MDPPDPYRFKIVRERDAATFDAVCVTLYRCEKGICGWYISPAGEALFDGGYVPKSAELIASSAVLRAMRAAERIGVAVCIVDPDYLWNQVWGLPD